MDVEKLINHLINACSYSLRQLNMSPIEVRIGINKDRDALELLTRLMIEERSEMFDMKRFEWGLLRRLYDPVGRHGIFVAEYSSDDGSDDKKIIGMIVSELRVDPHGFSEGYIKQLYVKSEFRGQGLGKRLLDALINHLKKLEIQVIKVNVKPGAEETFKMYSKRDFKLKYSVLSYKIDD